jgi:LPXTG-motif cell wall-anchored protein
VAALGALTSLVSPFLAATSSSSSSGGIQGWLLHLHGPVVYAAVGGLLFLEVGIIIGFFIPGEIATILGGVIASQHHADLALMIVVVGGCATLGNLSGYGVGHVIGPRVFELKYLKNNAGMIRTRKLIADRGGPAVFFARWIVFVRAVLPGVAGMTHMRVRTFAIFSLLGGFIWGSMWVTIGYAAGNSYAKVEKEAGDWSFVLLGVVAVLLVVYFIFRKRKEHRDNKALLVEIADEMESD